MKSGEEIRKGTNLWNIWFKNEYVYVKKTEKEYPQMNS